MTPHFYTLGMAGHIDHGKTTLTKALTNINTDRLKEEIEREISIELGYASFPLGEYDTTIIDVPGHEKFIRQMIAGVSGIDLVILVIAADEGVMPQTKEHLEILSFLGIEHGIIAVTKSDKIDSEFAELIKDDIQSTVENTIFASADVVFVDSVTGKGLGELKSMIMQNLSKIAERDAKGAFRLPIDQVFTLQGHGTIVRGTIHEGAVNSGDLLTLLPYKIPVKIRQLQVHNQRKDRAIAGQRVAINLSGNLKESVKRGDVLVSSEHFPQCRTIDVSLTTIKDLKLPLKQRARVKFYSGTSEVMGRIVLFDRKEAGGGEEVLCQIRLDELVVVKRGDRFVVRRPSPVETIGGGWVVDPFGEKYRFGEATIEMLERKRHGSPEDRLLDILEKQVLLTKNDLIQMALFDLETLEGMLSSLLSKDLIIAVEKDAYSTSAKYREVRTKISILLQNYHNSYPLRIGMNKAECVQALHRLPSRLIETVLEAEVTKGAIKRDKQYIALANFEPYYPLQWKQQIEQALSRLESEALEVRPFEEYMVEVNLPQNLQLDVKHFFIQQGLAYSLDDKYLIHHHTYDKQIETLYNGTNGQDFTVQEAKAVLNMTRKLLVLYLELLDQQRVTQRVEQHRKWLK